MPPGVDALTVRGNEVNSVSWATFLQEMDSVADELETEGWETIVMVAGDAVAIGTDHRDFDRHGFAYVVPGDVGSRFSDVFEPGGFPRTDVYAADGGTHQFLLTVLFDPDRDTAVLLAGAIEHDSIGACRQAAREADAMYTHILRIDGTHLGTVKHEDPTAFFPNEG